MDANRLFSALCYISLFFAPFLVPLIIYLVIPDRDVRGHAKNALISHIAPYILIPIVLIFGFQPNAGALLLVVMLSLLVLAGVFIWNIVMAIRVLTGTRAR